MNMIFYDYLNVYHTIKILFSRKINNEIHYFNLTRPAKFLLNLLKINRNIKLLDFKLSNMRDDQGANYFPKIYGKDLIDVCDSIEKEIIKKTPFIISLGRIFSSEKVFQFFKKMANENLQEIIIYMNAIEWHMKTNPQRQAENKIFYVEKTTYFDILSQFAIKFFEFELRASLSLRRMLYYFLLLSRNVLSLSMLGIRPTINILGVFKKKDKKMKIPMLGIPYMGNGASFELNQRCEFPWLLVSDIPPQQVIIYLRRKNIPFPERSLSYFKKRKISFFTLIKNKSIPKSISLYQPSIFIIKILLTLFLRAVFFIARDLVHGRFNSFPYFILTLRFIINYAKAYDFYSFTNIKININYDNYDPYRIPEHCALEALGGISIGYQLSCWPIPNVYLPSCTDIQFLFGTCYYKKFIRSGICSKNVLFYGYLNDYSFNAVKENSIKLRNKLTKNGAKFIVCYFDENSSDERMDIISNNKNARVYKKLLEWIISEETIGLICCPKNPTTLFRRLREIKELIEQAKATGRCIFMEGEYRTSCYPTEPAQGSDLVITLLLGGTVALESFLSGVRTVYLDLEGLYSYPEYQRGRNKIVFDDLDFLLHSIDKYRYNDEQYNEFGNLNLITNLKEKDSFQDGKAAVRIGDYLQKIIEKFNEGKAKEEIIAYANQKYTEVWGNENLV